MRNVTGFFFLQAALGFLLDSLVDAFVGSIYYSTSGHIIDKLSTSFTFHLR